MAKASAAYPDSAPNLKRNPEIFELWVERLADFDAREALANLNDHIDESEWFPKIASIKRQRESYVDPEIRARNIQIAHQDWVAAGNDPEEFVYEPNSGNSIRRLTS